MMEFVSWDDDIPNVWEKMFQTTNSYQYTHLFGFSIGMVDCQGANLFPNLPGSINGAPPCRTKEVKTGEQRESKSRIGHAATDGLPGIVEDTATQRHQKNFPATG